MLKNFNLSPEELSRFTQFETSIAHWSFEYTAMQLKTNRLLTSIDDLYQGRQKLLDGLLKSNGIDPKEVEGVNVNPNGEVSVSLRMPIPAPSPAPQEVPTSNGVADKNAGAS